ncbi:MAG: hypothetical protein O2923_11230 [Verrucomicrobia bacterium]|nr:hypothetical protein [Verrucomicrobiota bacterium]MDA1088100.1 hypothetical protein [Verrucomicrobiota bacterium]
MPLLVDTHLHIYPCYNVERALGVLIARLNHLAAGIAGEVTGIACLTERADCNFFVDAVDGRIDSGSITLEASESGDSLSATARDGMSCTLLPGRQIVTRERLEVLALTKNLQVADGQPIVDVIQSVVDQNAVPVVPWSPGKWMFGRGAVVREIPDWFGADQVCFGDTSLRPQGWPNPAGIRKARRKRHLVVAGSDPLPFAGEEAQMARYLTLIRKDGDGETVGDRLRAALLDPGTTCEFVGRRGSVFTVARRWLANQVVRSANVS